MKLVEPGFVWESTGSPDIDAYVDQVCGSWKGTRYMSGQMRKGAGVDCVRFVCAVLSELYGWALPRPECLPPDASMHDPEGMRASVREIMRMYEISPSSRVQAPQTLQPGDAIMTGPRGGGPGHAMFVGGTPNILWHVERKGRKVCSTGWAIFEEEQALFEAYRPNNKDQWLAAL